MTMSGFTNQRRRCRLNRLRSMVAVGRRDRTQRKRNADVDVNDLRRRPRRPDDLLRDRLTKKLRQHAGIEACMPEDQLRRSRPRPNVGSCCTMPRYRVQRPLLLIVITKPSVINIIISDATTIRKRRTVSDIRGYGSRVLRRQTPISLAVVDHALATITATPRQRYAYTHNLRRRL